jgi:hypothetical protein
LRGAVAEQLAEFLFVPGDAVLVDKCNEVARLVGRQGRAAEIGVRGKEIFRLRTDIGEIAAPAPGDTDFFAELFGVIDEQDSPAAFARLDRAHHAGRASTDGDDVGIHRAGRTLT